MTTVRPPAVAGTFYPADPTELRLMATDLLDRARASLGAHAAAPKAVIAPHAGYVYSGSTAAHAYARLERAAERVRRVLLLGPCHRVGIHGLALPDADRLATPLGELPVARPPEHLTAALPQLLTSGAAHAAEHSLEVHLPFLQAVLPDVEVVPLAVGWVTPEEVAQVLDALWGGPETAVVVSSDLSHYLPYDDARAVDQATLAQVMALDATLSHDQACGATPVDGLLLAAADRGLRPELLAACNSGDTAGDRRRVVGYASVAFHEAAA